MELPSLAVIIYQINITFHSRAVLRRSYWFSREIEKETTIPLSLAQCRHSGPLSHLFHIKGIAAKTDSSWAKLFREAGREWSLKSATDPYSMQRLRFVLLQPRARVREKLWKTKRKGPIELRLFRGILAV
jgi:hypothetical protein